MKGASGAGQGLLAGRRAGAATHRRKCNDRVGHEVAQGACRIVGPRIPVDQRLADSSHEADGILQQCFPHAHDRFDRELDVLNQELVQGDVARE